MKKFTAPIALALAALLFAGSLPSAALAMEPFAKPAALTEADRRSNFRRDRNRRPPPRPAPRPSRDRGRNAAPAVAGAIFGLALGGIIAGAIADSREPDVYYVEPAPPPVVVTPVVPVVPQQQLVQVCDQYGNCWYEYR